MSINCTVVNKNGDTYEVSKPCFGFMSYIHIWGNDDDGDWDSTERYEMEGFESDNLETLIYNASLFGGMSQPENVKREMRDAIYKAIEQLPQFYGNLTFEQVGNDNHYRTDFKWALEGDKMDKTICGAMMLRNMFCYSAPFQSMYNLLKMGATPLEASVLGNAYYYSTSFNGSYFYRSSGNDDSLFNNQTTIADIKHILKGGIGDTWQGVWGETKRGYQRYGELEVEGDAYEDPEQAPPCARTGRPKTLNTCMIIPDKKAVKDSPTLTRIGGRTGIRDILNHNLMTRS